jgi:ERCC4-type nuclease
MASITARDKTPVVMVGTTELLVDYATRLARKHLEDSDGLELPKSAVKRKEPTAKRMYGCIEGIGPEGAQTLYERWPSIAQFMSNADVDEIRKLDGFGKKTAEMVMDGFL